MSTTLHTSAYCFAEVRSKFELAESINKLVDEIVAFCNRAKPQALHRIRPRLISNSSTPDIIQFDLIFGEGNCDLAVVGQIHTTDAIASIVVRELPNFLPRELKNRGL